MKIEKYLKNLSKEKKSVYLTEKEKQIMKSELLNFVKNNPIEKYETPLHWTAFISFRSPVLKYASLLSVLSLAIFSGVSFAANNSLPGDTLYSVKVGVNEKVLGLLQVSDESKAQYNIELAELRLEEIEKISTKEIVDEKIKEDVNSLLDKHIAKVKKHSIKIENKNNPEISLRINSELEASLNAHKEILNKISEKREDLSAKKVKVVLLDIDEKFNKAKKQRQDSENAFSIKVESEGLKQAAEGKIKSAENKIEEVEKFMESQKDHLSEESFETAKVNLELAKSTIEKGKKSMESGNYQEAFLIFQKAIRIAQQAQISVRASVDLEINVFEVKDQNGDHEEDDKEEDSSKIDLDALMGINS